MTTASGEFTEESSNSCSFSFTTAKIHSGLRLDQYLVQHFPDMSRSQLAASVAKGLVRIGGKTLKNSYRLKPGDKVVGEIYVESLPSVEAEQIEFTILYEDKHLLVISKPPGLVVHPGSGNLCGTLVNGLLFHCQEIGEVGDPIRPGIVHRLDKDTSGIMVVAKKELIHRRLSSSFKEREVKKQYHTLVHGILTKNEGRLVASIGRHKVNRQKMAVREKGGKHAASSWKVIEVLHGKYSLVEVTIETGRTHQIRVHMAHLGHPVVGDLVYGKGRNNKDFPRQMLHASRLIFTHPVEGSEMNMYAPLWPDFTQVVENLRKK